MGPVRGMLLYDYSFEVVTNDDYRVQICIQTIVCVGGGGGGGRLTLECC